MVVAVIDYGMGNLHSVSKGLESVGAEVVITSDKDTIRNAQGIVLPGVGAFPQAMENLTRLGLVPVISEFAKKGKPFLGICLGFQLLFSDSEEGGSTKGLNILKGKVRKFSNKMKVPHMGWNEIKPLGTIKLLSGIELPCFMYFAHSYYVEPEDKEALVAITDYGIEFVSMMQKDNIYGVQFHPEKSGEKGLKILKNFCGLI